MSLQPLGILAGTGFASLDALDDGHTDMTDAWTLSLLSRTRRRMLAPRGVCPEHAAGLAGLTRQ